MAISSVGATASPYQPNVQSQQRQQVFQNLASALQSGDVAGAQTAFAALQKLQQGRPTPRGQPGETVAPQGHPSPTPIRTAVTALGAALHSGTLADAQSAFATLQQARPRLPPGPDGPPVAGPPHRPHTESTSEVTARTASPTTRSGARVSTRDGATVNVSA